MRELQHATEPIGTCPYLGDRPAALDVRILVDVTPEELETLLVRGWRRFGPSYFRPACAACQECVPIRIPTREFAPSRSQKRARAKCASFRVEIGPARVDETRLALYRRWHRSREAKRGWEPSPLDADGYAIEFAFPHPSLRELSYWDGERLVGVGICDETPRCWSAAYFYYDPEYARRSIGIANVVYQVELARERGIPYLYLGFRVADCPSMRYKATFEPHELLRTRPGLSEEPRWERV